MYTIKDICNSFPLYFDEEKEYIYTENFHDWEDDGSDGYYIGYESLKEDGKFIVKFEGTKTECANQLEEYLRDKSSNK